MAKTKKTVQSYYREHAKQLASIIHDYRDNRNSLFATSNYAVFNSLEKGITKFPLRYYQLEALYVLDYLYNESICEIARLEKAVKPKYNKLIAGLLDTVDEGTSALAPFIGYEMATGSGKTMLMGASIYLLNQKYDIKNFLIITPPSTDIYQKTIRNFTVGNYESVWADGTPFKFNLITGDNYTQNLFYNEDMEANIFVFNISKFGSNATNTTKTWEAAVWKDEQGNNISIKQYLKDKKLAIITDEAHHAQNRASNTIIKKFHPTVVLEFTATAVEETRSDEKKNQTIVYKYDIRKLLEDGHGKLVRAVALANPTEKKAKSDIPASEKMKIVTLFLIHLLKKKAVLLDEKARGLKPLSFVKVKDETSYAKKVFDYIKQDLGDDLENIGIILEKVQLQDLEITTLIKDLFEQDYKGDIDLLRHDISKAAQTAIFYHGKSDADTEKKFAEIRANYVEIVVYMQRLDEGIDLPNIYSMAVINDNISDFKTSVKQIIGRGVRINKETREFDELEDPLKQQAEKLHIVCDQGANFEEVIQSIQKEFGLTDKYMSLDKEKKMVTNHVKSDLLDKRFIPHIKADFRVKDNVNLFDLINDTETVVSNFLENNCFAGEEDEAKRFLKYRPDSFFQEVDIFSDKSVYHKQLQQSGGRTTVLHIPPKEAKAIYGHILGSLFCIPDTPSVKQSFQKYIDRFNEIGLQYYHISPSDEKLATNLFVSAFSFFYRNHIEKNYFKIEFRELRDDENWNLKTRFTDHELKLPVDQIGNTSWKRITDKTRLKSMVEGGFHFFGYDKSAYDYNVFDSYTEKQLADFADGILKESREERPTFWIKNKRNIHFTYGSKKYYPDFILLKDDVIYVVETKGEIFSDTKKNVLLKKLDEIDGYKGLLIFSHQMNLMEDEDWTYDQFIAYAEDILKKHQSKSDLLLDAPEEGQFIKYIPVYSPLNAYKKFIKQLKTPKPEGWLEVPQRRDGYPNTIFATQAKGEALYPEYSHNSWVILDGDYTNKSYLGKLALVHQKEILDEYEGNLTIRRIFLEEQQLPGKIFGERFVILKSVNPNVEDIKISDESGNTEIVGIIFE
jgi:superfamily II DNA or RNA helicase